MKKIALGFLLFIVFILSIITVVWFKLGLILNERTLTYLKNRYELPLSWDKLNVDVKNIGLSEKGLSLKSSDLCFTWENPQIQLCLAHLSFEAQVKLITSSPFVQIRNLALDAESSVANIVLLPQEEPAPPPEKPLWPDVRAPALADLIGPYLQWFDKETIRQITLKIPEALIQNQDLVIHASADLSSQDLMVNLTGSTSIHRQKDQYLKADLKIEFDMNNPRLDVHVKANSPLFKSQADLAFNWQKNVSLAGSITSTKFVPLNAKLKVQSETRAWKITLDSDADLQRWNMGKAQLKGCELAVLLSSDGTLSEANLPCQIEMFGVQKLKQRHLPSTINIDLNSRNKFALSRNTLVTESHLDVDSKNNTLIDIDMKGEARATINMLTYEITSISLPEFISNLKIEKVKSWHEIFKKNNIPLPAPFNVVDGPLDLSAHIKSPDFKLIAAEVKLATDLTGERQAFITESEAKIDVDLDKYKIDVTGDSRLREIALDLPYIGLEAPPQITPDSRFSGIEKEPKAKASKWSFNIARFSIKTPEKPLILRTRLLKEDIPIRLDYTLANTELAGFVGLDPFSLELFKKKFNIEKMKVIKRANSDIMDLDGEMTFKNSEVKVSILVIGTTTSPKIEFLSDPPLSREQIISVVLFNKSLQQLTDEDMVVAGQMNQALLSDAFGIFSLLFLSQTPIESIYYDPVSKSYTARVKLDDQTSLSLGSNFDTSQQFQLRRRLGGPWSVVTQLQKSQNADDVITTLIEWFKRF